MHINKFKLERYFAQHEFTAKYLMSSSDCDGYDLKYVLEGASIEELQLWEDLKLGYTESEGHALLREAILKHYKLETINHVVVASPGELNFCAMNVLLEPDDHVITVAPSYQSLYEIVQSVKCELSLWKVNSEDWSFDVGELEDLIKENTKLIILNFPHNPTGSYLTIDQLNQIISIARKHNLYIFSDEMYHKLVLGDTIELPPICDLYEKGISLWGMSKTFGLAGLRLGWLVSQDLTLLSRVIAFKDYLSICNSAPSEILSIMALNSIDRFIIPNINKIQKNISLFENFAREHDQIGKFVVPKAGSTAFVPLQINLSSQDFSDQLVSDTGIMTVPAEMFEHKGKFIRVGFGRKNFPEILDRLHDYFNLHKFT